MDECEFYEFDGICSKYLPHELLCSQINGCTYKQLLAEQTKNKKLVEALEKIATQKIDYSFDGLCNLKLDSCTNDCKNCLKSLAQQALNEVNK